MARESEGMTRIVGRVMQNLGLDEARANQKENAQQRRNNHSSCTALRLKSDGGLQRKITIHNLVTPLHKFESQKTIKRSVNQVQMRL